MQKESHYKWKFACLVLLWIVEWEYLSKKIRVYWCFWSPIRLSPSCTFWTRKTLFFMFNRLWHGHTSIKRYTYTQGSHPVELITMLGLICFLGRLFITFTISYVFLYNSCLVCVLPSSSSMPSRCCIHWTFRAVIHLSRISDPTSPISISWAHSEENVAVIRGFASIRATLNVLTPKTCFFLYKLDWTWSLSLGVAE